MTEQQETSTPEAPETQEAKENAAQEVVEVPWEEIAPLLSLRQRLARAESEVSKFLLEVEKKKLSYLDHISALEAAIISNAKELQEIKGLDTAETYELKMPTAENEKGYFVRKES